MKNVTWQITVELDNGKTIEGTVVNSVESSTAMAGQFIAGDKYLLLDSDKKDRSTVIPVRRIVSITFTKKENENDQDNY